MCCLGGLGVYGAMCCLGDLGVYGGIIFKMYLKGNDMGKCGLDSSGPGFRKVAGPYEHDAAASGSMSCGEILDWLTTSRDAKNDSARS